MHKDNMKFHVINTDPVKNTVTLRPSFGTIIKINVAAAAIAWMAVRWAELRQDDRDFNRTMPDADPVKS